MTVASCEKLRVRNEGVGIRGGRFDILYSRLGPLVLHPSHKCFGGHSARTYGNRDLAREAGIAHGRKALEIYGVQIPDVSKQRRLLS